MESDLGSDLNFCDAYRLAEAFKLYKDGNTHKAVFVANEATDSFHKSILISNCLLQINLLTAYKSALELMKTACNSQQKAIATSWLSYLKQKLSNV